MPQRPDRSFVYTGMKRYLILGILGVGILGLAIRATLAAIERGEHTPNLMAAAAGAVAAAFIIGLNAGRGAGRS